MAVEIEEIRDYDIYTTIGVDENSEDDEIDFLEEGFMKGYLEADNIDI